MYFKVDVKYEANEPPSKNQITMDLKSKTAAKKDKKGAKKKSKVPVTAIASKRNVKLEAAFDAVRERIGDQTDFSQFTVKTVQT